MKEKLTNSINKQETECKSKKSIKELKTFIYKWLLTP